MPAKTKTEIGAEIESICTKCKSPTVHVITALDGDNVTKVMCKICQSYHKPKFEEEPAKKKKVKRTTKKTATAQKTSQKKSLKTSEERKWNRLLKKVDEDEPVDYIMSESYINNSVISHPAFGLGVVTDVLSQKKIQVFFQDGEKTLVHNWG